MIENDQIELNKNGTDHTLMGRYGLVGGDSGAYENEGWKNNVIIGPSERAIIEVLFEDSGSYALKTKTPNKKYTLGKIMVFEEEVDVSYSAKFYTLKTNEDTVQSIEQFRQYFDKTPDKNILLTVDMI